MNQQHLGKSDSVSLVNLGGEMTHNIRISALLISLIFLLPGCLSYPPSQDSSSDEGTVFQMNPISYDIIIGDQYLEIDNQQKLDFFTKLLEKNHNNILKNSTIPKIGGNWSHYFVCGDGTPIEYSSLEREYYFCPSTSEQLSGEQYLSSWRTLRHRELIQEFGLTSSLSYVLTGNSSEGLLAKNLLLNYSIIYPNLPISDKLNRTGDIGGKLTSQSLDEAVFLIDFAWMYHMIHPILN